MKCSSKEKIIVDNVFSRPQKPRALAIKECFDILKCEFTGVDFFSSAACLVRPDIKVSPSRVLVCANIGLPAFFVDSVDNSIAMAEKLGSRYEKYFSGFDVSDDLGQLCGRIVKDDAVRVFVDISGNDVEPGTVLFPTNVKKTFRNGNIYSPLVFEDVGIYTVIKLISKVLDVSDKLIFNVHGLGYTNLSGFQVASRRINPMVVIDIESCISAKLTSVYLEVYPTSNRNLVDLFRKYSNMYEVIPKLGGYTDKVVQVVDGIYIKVLVPCFVTASSRFVNESLLDELTDSLLDICIEIGQTDFRVM